MIVISPYCVACTLPRLEGWHIALTVIGAITFVVAVAINILGMVLSCMRRCTGE